MQKDECRMRRRWVGRLPIHHAAFCLLPTAYCLLPDQLIVTVVSLASVLLPSLLSATVPAESTWTSSRYTPAGTAAGAIGIRNASGTLRVRPGWRASRRVI